MPGCQPAWQPRQDHRCPGAANTAQKCRRQLTRTGLLQMNTATQHGTGIWTKPITEADQGPLSCQAGWDGRSRDPGEKGQRQEAPLQASSLFRACAEFSVFADKWGS